MALHQLARHRAVLGLVVLIIGSLFLLTAGRLLAAPRTGLAPGCDSAPQAAQAISAAAAAAISQSPELAADPQHAWRVHSVCQQGGWAYAFLKGYSAATGAPLSSPSLVALAHQTGSGWQVVLPQDANDYDQELAAVPAALLSDAAKTLLVQPAPPSPALPCLTRPGSPRTCSSIGIRLSISPSATRARAIPSETLRPARRCS